MGDIVFETDAGRPRGLQREIACDCWFTTGGRTIPRLIKAMDQEGMVHTLRVDRVLTAEEKNYAGVATVEHICQITRGDRQQTVKLIYRKESCTWTLVTMEDN